MHGSAAAQPVADAAGSPLVLIEPPIPGEPERLPAPRDGIALLGGRAAVPTVLIRVLRLQVVLSLQQTPRAGTGPGPTAPPSPIVAPTARAAASLPVRLSIPRRTIDAAVEQSGVVPDRTVEVSIRFARAGWYRRGRRPGDLGHAVLAGHRDSRTGPAIVWRLKALQPGDEVLVTGDDGQEQRCLVRTHDTDRSDQVPIKQIFDRRPQNDDQRLVVATTPAG